MKFQSRQVLISPGPLGRDELLHRSNIDLASGLDETGEGLTLGQDALGHVLHVNGRGDLVQTGLEVVVGHVLEAVAHVDVDLSGVLVHDGDKGVGLGAEAVLDLEAAGVVLEEERDHAKVRVRPGAAVLARGELLRGDGGVVVHAQLVNDGRRAAALHQLALGEAEALLQELQHLPAHDVALFQQVLHELTVAWNARLGRPLARVLSVTRRAVVKVLLQGRNVSAIQFSVVSQEIVGLTFSSSNPSFSVISSLEVFSDPT